MTRQTNLKPRIHEKPGRTLPPLPSPDGLTPKSVSSTLPRRIYHTEARSSMPAQLARGEPGVIFFQEISSKERGPHIRVINGPFSLGWIALPANGDARYRYYEPESNDRTPTLSGTDLTLLKRQISARRP